MGIGKMMSKTVAPEGVGKFSKQRYGIGKMNPDIIAEERKAGLKATDDIEKMISSKK